MPDPPEALLKKDFLARIGYGGDPALAECVLIEAGLTNARKPRISSDKLARADAELRKRFAYACQRGDCRAAAARLFRDREVVPASAPEFCVICGGSVNRAAVDRLVEVFARARMRRLCVVGGSPALRDEFSRLVSGRIDLRLVDGTANRNHAAADADLAWADRVVVWASTQLDHRVSTLYRGPKVITAPKRSIGTLCDDVIRSIPRG